MADEDVSQLIRRETARAIPWGVMLLVVMLIGGMWVKHEIREGIEFASQTLIRDAKRAVLDPQVFIPLKKNAREAIQYTARTAMDEAKQAMLATGTFVPIKRNAKEAIEFTAKTAADQYKRVQMELNGRR